MRSLHFTIAKNAVANIVRGAASGIVALVLPHFLTHSLGADRFAGWALMLQLAAYANYLEFGIQTALARYLAGALEVGDQDRCKHLLSNAVALLTMAAAGSVCLLGVLVWQMPHLFHSIPSGLSTEIGFGVMILGVSAALGLPLSAYTGVLVGMQRNEFPALAVAISRFVSVLAVVTATHYTHSLTWLALCVGGCNLFAAILQYAAVRRLLPWLQCRLEFVNRQTVMEFVRYCSTLSVWSFSMLLVSGLDVTLVGLFNFQAVGAYSIAATLLVFYTGLVGAAFGAMMAPIAVLQARKEYGRISELVMVTTRLSSYISMAAIVMVFLFGEIFIRTWVGPAYMAITLPVLKILLFAQAIRLVGNAYGTALVAMGLQKMGIMPAIFEALTNLLLSVLGMMWIGPKGVAWATLTAAALALGITVFYLLPRIKELSLRSVPFLWQGAGVPFVAFIPFCAWMVARNWTEAHLPAVTLVRWIPYLLLLTAVGISWSGVRRTLREMPSI
jgi:O-antigen/teichoic acid export membrane protein